MKFAEFKNQIEGAYKAKFPDSLCSVSVSSPLLSDVFGKSIWITCKLANNIDEVSNNIWANDMFNVGFIIDLPDGFNIDNDLPEEMVLEATEKNYAIIPENKYMCYGSRKLSFRKTTGNSEKIIKSFNNFVNRLYNSLKEDINSGNIHKNFSEIVANKVR